MTIVVSRCQSHQPSYTAFTGDPAQKSGTAFGEVFVATHWGDEHTCAPGCNSLLFVFMKNVITDVEYLADENSVHFLHNNAVQRTPNDCLTVLSLSICLA